MIIKEVKSDLLMRTSLAAGMLAPYLLNLAMAHPEKNDLSQRGMGLNLDKHNHTTAKEK